MNKTWIKLLIVVAIVGVGIGLMIYGSRKGADTTVKDLGSRTPGKVRIVEYADFQCPACALAEPIVEEILKSNAGKVEFEFRHFPLPMHANAIVAGEAAEAARSQDKFDEMKHELYAKQTDWAESPDPRTYFIDLAGSLGMDKDKFDEELKSGSSKGKIQGELDEGVRLGVNATPTFFINGRQVVGVPGTEFDRVLKEELNTLGR